MKQKDIIQLVFIGIMAAVISLFVSSMVFNSPKKRSSKIPLVNTIQTSMPDVKNDSNYSHFLNSKALDPTQPVQIGDNNKDQTLFNATR